MTLRIDLTSPFAPQVYADLTVIAGDDAPKTTLEQDGQVIFHAGPQEPPGGFLIANLSVDPEVRVTIVAADGNAMRISTGIGNATVPLCARGLFWSTPGTSGGPLSPTIVDIQVVYDPAAVGGPYFGYDGAGNELPISSASMLTFALSAAYHYAGTSYINGPLPSSVSVDPAACLKIENDFRISRFMAPRSGPHEVFGTVCAVKPNRRTTPPPSDPYAGYKGKVYHLPKCFVATAAYGSPLAEEVDFLRRFRDDVVTRTRGGYEFISRFHEHYYRISPAISASMLDDPELTEVMRQGIVEPLIHWLEVALLMPDDDLSEVPEPWLAFLDRLRRTLEEWASEIVMSNAGHRVQGLEGAREYANILRFVMRTTESRNRFLCDLEHNALIPLDLETHDRRAAQTIFEELGRPGTEIDRVLGGVR